MGRGGVSCMHALMLASISGESGHSPNTLNYKGVRFSTLSSTREVSSHASSSPLHTRQPHVRTTVSIGAPPDLPGVHCRTSPASCSPAGTHAPTPYIVTPTPPLTVCYRRTQWCIFREEPMPRLPSACTSTLTQPFQGCTPVGATPAVVYL